MQRQIFGQSEAENKVESEIVILPDMSNTEDTDIQMLLSDPCPPEQDLLSCFAVSTLSESYYATKDILTPKASCSVQKFGALFSNKFGLQDEVSFSLKEGHHLQYGVRSPRFEAFLESFKNSCSVKLYCTHASDGTDSCSGTDAKDRNCVDSPQVL
ncbi:hypothetical protein MKX03_008503 [Papaver bracteatum]|nr:hypothetical protein MKX03_008503 [Papaver bracteatum]